MTLFGLTTVMGDASWLKSAVCIGFFSEIVVIGLGYVGLPLAVSSVNDARCLVLISTRRRCRVTGWCDSTLKVTPDELAQTKYLSYSTNPEDFYECWVFIVTVPTSVDKANRPDMTLRFKTSRTEGKVMPQGTFVRCGEDVRVPCWNNSPVSNSIKISTVGIGSCLRNSSLEENCGNSELLLLG